MPSTAAENIRLGLVKCNWMDKTPQDMASSQNMSSAKSRLHLTMYITNMHALVTTSTTMMSTSAHLVSFSQLKMVKVPKNYPKLSAPKRTETLVDAAINCLFE